MNLLSIQQQQAIKAISKNNLAMFDDLAREVEDRDMINFLGIALLQDLQENQETEPNKKLLDGASFTDCNGNTIKHKGVRFVEAYLVWADYVKSVALKDTQTGFVKKKTDQSDPITEGDTRRLVDSAVAIANAQWVIVKDFLNANKADYPLWNCANSINQTRRSKIYGVKKTTR